MAKARKGTASKAKSKGTLYAEIYAYGRKLAGPTFFPTTKTVAGARRRVGLKLTIKRARPL